MKKPELMAPAGNWTMLTTIVQNGADAVYFGVDKLNMRIKAKNFSIDDLPRIANFCKENKVKSYLTVNSIVFESELVELDELICKAKAAGVDMVICWDMSVINTCRKYDMSFCISTQASISNSSSADFYKQIGAKRIVLARECSLNQIKEIRAKTDLEIEAFVHGAMCIAVSGRCFMSHHLFGKSANRGECIQPCRRLYEVYDKEINKSMLVGEDYVLSPKDLCSIAFLDLLIETGIDSFKIEGRKRSPEYVAKVVSIYRQAIDLYFKSKFTPEIKENFVQELRKVYNRGFSSGFYFDIPGSEEYIANYGSIATTRKEFIGKVLNYFKTPKVALVRLKSGSISLNDELLIIGETTGVVEVKIESLIKDEKIIDKAEKGDDITFLCSELVRPGDMVYKINNVKTNG